MREVGGTGPESWKDFIQLLHTHPEFYIHLLHLGFDLAF